MLIQLEKWMDRTIDAIGYLAGVLLILMILNMVWDVIMLHAFRALSPAMQEMEWHLFSVIILYGTGYALRHNAHVRVDFVYDRLSERKKAWINIVGTILFLLPLAVLIVYGSYDFVMDAYTTHEISEDPGGLHYRWLIKAQIPIAFVFLIFCALNYILHHINVLRGFEPILAEEEEEIL